MSKIQNILNKLNIDETFNKRVYKEKSFNKVKDNIPLIENCNMMADILFLPTAKFGFKYLFVIVDLATDEFDIQEMKEKTPDTVLKAMKKCFTREYIKKPEYSLKTDNGSEFKGVFHKYLYDESILHKTGLPDRHNSLSNVESLNKQLGRLFNGYMNHKEELSGKEYKNWTDVISIVRDELNTYRKKKLPNDFNSYSLSLPKDYKTIETKLISKDKKGNKKTITKKVHIPIKPKFKVGQLVHRALDRPVNALGKVQSTKNFRMNDYSIDKTPREILQIFTFSGDGPLYRYLVEGIPNVSFTENQLTAEKI
jgi:hypothetical protein